MGYSMGCSMGRGEASEGVRPCGHWAAANLRLCRDRCKPWAPSTDDLLLVQLSSLIQSNNMTFKYWYCWKREVVMLLGDGFLAFSLCNLGIFVSVPQRGWITFQGYRNTFYASFCPLLEVSQSLPTFTNHLEMQVRHKCKNNIIGIVLLFFLKEIAVFHKAEHMISCLLCNNSLVLWR